MKVTKKHLGYAAVLAVGGGWLLSDLVSGPATGGDAAAIAAVVEMATTPGVAVDSGGGAAVVRKFTENGDEAEMAERLAAVAARRGVDPALSGDGYALPAAFRPVETVAAKEAAPVQPSQIEAFGKKHKLVSVVVGRNGSGGAGAAQVDGRFLKVGDEVDGFKLTGVTQQAATFEGTEGKVELRFDDAMIRNATAAVPIN